MEDLLKRVGVVVVTRGAEGSSVITQEGEKKIKATSATATDPTGAGDAYRAGFAKGFLAGLPHEISGQIGSAVAAYTVEKAGTQNHTFTLDELKKRYAAEYGQVLAI